MNTLAAQRFRRRWGQWFDLVPTDTAPIIAVVCAGCQAMERAYSCNIFWVMSESAFKIKHGKDCTVPLVVASSRVAHRELDDRRRRAELSLLHAHAHGVRT